MGACEEREAQPSTIRSEAAAEELRALDHIGDLRGWHYVYVDGRQLALVPPCEYVPAARRAPSSF